MDCLKSIQERKSIRRFEQGNVVARETILAILNAGRLAPSGGNSQPWRFVVVDSEDKRSELQSLIDEREDIEAQRRIAKTASALVAVLYERTTPHGELKAVQAIGASIQNILLASHALGVGACWLGHHRDGVIEKALGCAYTEELMAIIAIGKPDENPPRRPRKPLDQLARFI